MARFAALDELLDEALELPVKGRDGSMRTYRIPSPSSEDGIKVQRITNLAARLLAGGEAIDTDLLDDKEELDLISLCLGPTDAEMQADGVDWAWRRHAGLTAMFWIINDLDAAQRYWEAKGDPKSLASRAARRAKTSGSASASTTRSTTSTTTTSARRATAKGRKAAKT